MAFVLALGSPSGATHPPSLRPRPRPRTLTPSHLPSGLDRAAVLDLSSLFPSSHTPPIQCPVPIPAGRCSPCSPSSPPCTRTLSLSVDTSLSLLCRCCCLASPPAAPPRYCRPFPLPPLPPRTLYPASNAGYRTAIRYRQALNRRPVCPPSAQQQHVTAHHTSDPLGSRSLLQDPSHTSWNQTTAYRYRKASASPAAVLSILPFVVSDNSYQVSDR